MRARDLEEIHRWNKEILRLCKESHENEGQIRFFQVTREDQASTIAQQDKVIKAISQLENAKGGASKN